ncbi:MAG: HEAT repeat domain-containing protein [Bryobacteraceae bacterium]
MKAAPALCAGFALLAAACSTPPASQPRFRTLPGFTVEPAATGAGSIVAFTFDSRGRPVIAKERGQATVLIDADNDGFYETQQPFSDRVHTIQGLWFDGNTLYAVGKNAAEKPEESRAGLYKLTANEKTGRADTFEQLALFQGDMREHGPHDIRRGPDGAPTILLGNHTAVPPDRIDPASPLRGLREWQLLDRYMDARGHAAGIMAPGGTLVRWNEDRRTFTLLAGGFRNAYNHAYNPDGDAFTFDSDMEWDINLPWYRAVRTLHVVPGGDYGWRTGSGKFPGYFFDTLPPVREAGRGSPVGVEFYQHRVYPPEYHGAYFEGDWSRGRILVSRPARSGATYSIPGEPTGFVHGEPLNVTDLEVGPDGFLYFSTGGRDTEGGFYRVRYKPGFWDRLWGPSEPDGALALVRQPQPLSSWSWAELARRQEAMGARWGEELEKLARNPAAESADRVQALFLLQRFGPKPRAELLRPLSADPDPHVRSAAIYVVGLHGSDRAKAIAVAGLKDPDPFVLRRAAEAVVRMGLAPDQPFAPVASVYPLLKHGDRFVRYAGRLALERIAPEEWRETVFLESDPAGAAEGLLALIRSGEPVSEAVFEKLLALLRRPKATAEERLAALRIFAIAAAETEDGVRPTLRKQVSDLVLPLFPTADERVNRELARVLAYCGQPEAIAKILAAIPRDDTNQPLQIHYAYCLRAIPGGWTSEQNNAMVRWFQKASKWRGGASFTGFLNLMFDAALEHFTAGEKALAYRRVPEFAPIPAAKAVPAVARARGVASISEQEILEFQLFDPMTLRADPTRGKVIFEKECASCHRFGDAGNDFGPDLTTLAARFRKKDILEAILWPSRTVSDQYGSVIIETRQLGLVNGLLVREDANRIVLKTGDVPQPVEIPKREVTSRRKSDISIMPEKLLDGYGQGEIADLLAYLASKP